MGFQYFCRGLRLISGKSLRHFVIVPLIINMVLFSGMIYLLFRQAGVWVDHLVSSLPAWLDFVRYPVWLLLLLVVIMVVFFTFTMLANLIASPFNGLLSEKVEEILTGRKADQPFAWRDLPALVGRSFRREFEKFGYFAPRALLLLGLSLLPVINLLAAPLWLLFSIWMMAVQYVDFPADNRNTGWSEMLAWLRRHRRDTLGFGGTVYLAMLVPGLNLVVIPAAAAGAPVFWLQGQAPDQS